MSAPNFEYSLRHSRRQRTLLGLWAVLALLLTLLIWLLAVVVPRNYVQDQRQLFRSDAVLRKVFFNSGFKLARGVLELACVPPASDGVLASFTELTCTITNREFLSTPTVFALSPELAALQETGFLVRRSQDGMSYDVRTLPGPPATRESALQSLAAANWLQTESRSPERH